MCARGRAMKTPETEFNDKQRTQFNNTGVVIAVL